jgi:hypothetical protein
MNKTLVLMPIIVLVVAAGLYFVFLQKPGDTTPTSNPGGTTPSPKPTPTTTPPAKVVNVVKYKTASCIDAQGTGIEAFSMLIPSDWTFEGEVTWVLNNPIMPATARFSVRNPNGTVEFEGLPNHSMFWTDNPLIQYTNPPGSRYFGALVMKPLGAIDSLKQIVVPMYRGDVANLKYVSEEKLPELAKLFPSGVDPVSGISYEVEAGKVRVEYNLNGVQMEDEIYCVIQSVKTPVGQATNNNWFVSSVSSFRAVKGKLDSYSKTLQTIAFSSVINLKWLNKYNQLVLYLIQQQIQQIKNIGQLSNMLSQMSDEISQDNLKSWEARQAANDKLVDDFTHGILGVDSYYDPIAEKAVELPSGYKNAWTNSLGEYILADDPSFNPNIGSNLNWQPMKTGSTTHP